MQQTLTIAEIKAQYPNQWVLVGNPILDETFNMGTVLDRLVKGFVLAANKSKQELAKQAKELRKGFDSVACIYTGEFPQNRKWLL
jgi:hypothetical protein